MRKAEGLFFAVLCRVTSKYSYNFVTVAVFNATFWFCVGGYLDRVSNESNRGDRRFICPP